MKQINKVNKLRVFADCPLCRLQLVDSDGVGVLSWYSSYSDEMLFDLCLIVDALSVFHLRTISVARLDVDHSFRKIIGNFFFVLLSFFSCPESPDIMTH